VGTQAEGALRLGGSETNEHRRELARAMGADVVVNPVLGDAASRIRSEADGTGVDVLLDVPGDNLRFLNTSA
jgi:threonine 3-dehydrogenase